MKRYDDSFTFWQDFQNGTLESVHVKGNIHEVTVVATGEKVYTFVDETENFFPHGWPTAHAAQRALIQYCKQL
ncbi:hypothetical protein [Yersinia phage vB_YenM_P778]